MLHIKSGIPLLQLSLIHLYNSLQISLHSLRMSYLTLSALIVILVVIYWHYLGCPYNWSRIKIFLRCFLLSNDFSWYLKIHLQSIKWDFNMMLKVSPESSQPCVCFMHQTEIIRCLTFGLKVRCLMFTTPSPLTQVHICGQSRTGWTWAVFSKWTELN